MDKDIKKEKQFIINFHKNKHYIIGKIGSKRLQIIFLTIIIIHRFLLQDIVAEK